MLMPIMISMTRFYRNSKLYNRLNSVSFHNSAIIFSSALLIVLFSITACEEKPTIIGSGLLPGSDFVNIKTDTSIHVEAYTLFSDSVVTNSRTLSYLGSFSDPYFGESKTDFVGQFRLDTAWTSDVVAQIDSVKLFIALSGAKGKLDSTTIHKIKIFEIDEILNSTDKYYSNREPDTLLTGALMATVSLPVITNDTSQSYSIRLDNNSFGAHLLRDPASLSQDKNGNPFKSFFKGVYVTMVDSPNPVLLALDWSTAQSTPFGITVYYVNSQGTSKFFNFIIRSTSVRYNRYTHKYAKATSPYKLDTARIIKRMRDSLIYLQAFNGVHPQIQFQGLKAIKGQFWDSVKNIPIGSVNKARLTFSVFLDESTYTTTTVPTQIFMKYIKSDTAQYIVPDYQVSPSFFDGVFNSTNKTFSFNLASFMQEYFKGNIIDPVVYMYYPEGEFRNVILKANNSRSPVKFEFVYTKF